MDRPVAPTDDQTAWLHAWTSLALEKMPYMASTLLALRPLSAPGLGTFAVDRWLRCYVDFDAVGPKGPVWCAEALLHESCHVFRDHAARSVEAAVRSAERKFWNFSADAEINDDLAEAGCSTIAEDGILPSTLGAPDNLTAEEYLKLIREHYPQSEQSQDDSSGQQGDDGQPFEGAGLLRAGNPHRVRWPPTTVLAGSHRRRPHRKRSECG